MDGSDIKTGTAFSYTCQRCGRCCQNMRIQINPYEAARLQHSLGLTTQAFRAQYTQDGAGVVLSHQKGGACVFFGEQGCRVHADRPLVCRLFPLGRQINADGEVRILNSDFDPPASGDFGRDGTIADYFEEQGAAPFMTAADAYFAWYVRATSGHSDFSGTDDLGDLLDMDGVLANHARRSATSEPGDIEARTTLHLELLNSLI